MQTDPRAIRAMTDSLALFLVEMSKEDQPPNALAFPNDKWSMVSADGAHFVFRREETRNALEGFRKRFRRPEWTRKWSEDYITKIENSLLRAASRDSTKTHMVQAVSIAASTLNEEPPERIVILPIAQIHVGELEINFPNIAIKTVNEKRLAEIRDNYYSIIDKTPHTEEEKTFLKSQIKERTEIQLGRVCIFVTTSGDVERVKENAKQKSEAIIDFFQMVATIFESQSKRIIIRIGGDLVMRQPGIIILSTDGSKLNDEWNMLFDFRLEVTQAILDKMKSNGFEPLMSILGKTELNEMEKTIIQSMHWIADGGRQKLPENKTTSYITAIEMFFSTKGELINRDVSEGIAMLLGSTLESRKAIVKQIRTFYDQRSSISHAGARLSEETSEIHEIANVAIDVLAKMCLMSSQVSTLAGIKNWMVDQRLSPKI